MGNFDIDQAIASDMTNRVDDVTIDEKTTNGVNAQGNAIWTNKDFPKWNGYFWHVADLQSALLMKSAWNVGKGYTTDPETEVILDHIIGWGKDTFDDILFNMDLVSNINGDSYSEIIRAKRELINLKPLDPQSINHIVGPNGLIKYYEQTSKNPNSKPRRIKPENMLHFCKNRVADSIHGLGRVEALEPTILADNESFTDLKKIMHHQIKPFLLWKLKTDDPVKISEIVRKIDNARDLGEDMFIPDDEDTITYERIEINLSDVIFKWREDVRNKFYRFLGLPLVVFGAGGSTESGGKMEMFAHEQVFERDQRWIEKQLWNQLQLKIDLVSPVGISQNLATDEAKDKSASGLPQGAEIQPADTKAGVVE